MKVLVVGGTGFLGSHLVDKLILRGHSVSVLSRGIRAVRGGDVSNIEFIPGDISRLESVPRALGDVETIVYAAMPSFKLGRMTRRRFAELEDQIRCYTYSNRRRKFPNR